MKEATFVKQNSWQRLIHVAIFPKKKKKSYLKDIVSAAIVVPVKISLTDILDAERKSSPNFKHARYQSKAEEIGCLSRSSIHEGGFIFEHRGPVICSPPDARVSICPFPTTLGTTKI